MSLAAHFLRQAVETSASESTRRLGIDDWRAGKLAPIALSLLMRGLIRRAKSPVGALLLSLRLNQYQEDLLASQRRLSSPDIRARGQALRDDILGPYCNRAILALADLAAIDPHRASELLSMSAVAAVSALSRARRELGLKTFELRGVLKSEAASVDNTDPRLARQVSAWVFRPSWVSRARERVLAAILGMRGPANERPHMRLKQRAPAPINASADQCDSRILAADARFRVVAGESRRNQAKSSAMLTRTLRSGSTLTNPRRTGLTERIPVAAGAR